MKRNIATLALPLFVFVAFLLPLFDGFTDDGFIHIQYARNLVTRGEYSFNPGETSFGTTSPLWVMELAAAGAIMGVEGDEFVAISRVLSWLAGILTIVALYALALMVGCTRLGAVVAALAIAADAWFTRWTALSMETSTAVFLCVLLCMASARASRSVKDAGAFGALLALASLVRPEVYLAVPVFALALFSCPGSRRRITLLAAVGAAALLIGPWLVFAKVHIGSLLPNTAGAKSGGIGVGVSAVFHRVVPALKILGSSQAIALTAVAIALFVRRSRSRLLDPSLRFAALWLVALPAAYVIFDIQILSRYLSLVTPAACVLGVVAIEDLSNRSVVRRRLLIAFAVATVTINAVFYARVVVPPSRAFTYDLRHGMKGLATWLHDNSDPGDVVAAADIGYLAFYSQRRVLDLGGLVEPETGKLRERMDYEEIVDRALYMDVPGYPHVDYFVDRETVPARFDGAVIGEYRFERVYETVVRNLGIRKPGPYYYVLYRIRPVNS